MLYYSLWLCFFSGFPFFQESCVSLSYCLLSHILPVCYPRPSAKAVSPLKLPLTSSEPSLHFTGLVQNSSCSTIYNGWWNLRLFPFTHLEGFWWHLSCISQHKPHNLKCSVVQSLLILLNMIIRCQWTWNDCYGYEILSDIEMIYWMIIFN